MPELPEVERVRRLLEKHVLGSVLQGVEMPTLDEKIFDVNFRLKCQDLPGKKVSEVGRYGKHFWLSFRDDGPRLGGKEKASCMTIFFHLGMTGSVEVKGEDDRMFYQSSGRKKARPSDDYSLKEKSVDESWPPAYTKLLLQFSIDAGNKVMIAFSDPRRFGRVKLMSENVDPKTHLCESYKLGPDAMLDLPSSSLEQFRDMLVSSKKTKSAIKSVLLDQSFVSGIGNWMADEILFQSKVHPGIKVCNLTEKQISLIFKMISHVVQVACDANANADKYPTSWIFHRRWSKGRKLKDADSSYITFVTIGGRTCAIDQRFQILSME